MNGFFTGTEPPAPGAGCPRGYTETAAGGAVDYAPVIGMRDCLRKIAAAPGLMSDAVERAAAETERAAAECYAHVQTGRCLWVAHRVAADRMRVRMIELLAAAHRPPAERDPYPDYADADEAPTRSRLFRELETHYLAGIDAVAAVVGGSEPGDTNG